MKLRFRTLALAAVLAAAGVVANAQTVSEIARLMRGTAGSAGAGAELVKLGERAAERFAIVIGNSKYRNVSSLVNAAADARAMAAFLRSHGFQVFEHYDLDKRGFEELLRQVLVKVDPSSEVLFYYAGHGIQIGRRNYIIPTDADLTSAYDTPFETVTLDSVVAILAARSRLQLVILDSCRNNPFNSAKVMTEVDSTLFEARDGFNPMSAPVNTLVAYSTSPGRVALDGEGDNSPFTASLLRVASAAPTTGIGNILETVRREVYSETNGEQVPWESSTLVEPFRFDRDEAEGTVAASAAQPTSRSNASSVGRAIEIDAANVTSSSDGGIVLEGPLEKRLALGKGLLAFLDLDTGDSVALSPTLPGGRLLISDGTVRDYDGTPLTPDRLAELVYEYTPVPKHATGAIAEYGHRERFSVTVAAGAAGSNELVAELNLTPDPCDFEAGDWLDPDGIGLARYPNEIIPETALAACTAAVERAPDVGRFHYQLGRALQALRRYDEASAAFAKARDLGHTRAWHALGDLAAEGDAIEGGRADQRVSMEALELYSVGVEKGDPYAYHALGKQLLRYGDTKIARRSGFELLSRALEVGHTFSMNELGYYFIRDDSPDFEPQRGLRYLEESAARNDIYGFHNLGLVYDAGLGGIAADAALALEWYDKAAAGGHPHAPINIGRMYFQGKLGDAPDLANAIRWYDKGLERGSAWGGANASWIIANHKPHGYTMADAAIRAAKTVALRDEEPARQARDLLASLGERDMNRAAQTFLSELGNPVAVDGVIGPQTQAAISTLLAKNGLDSTPATPVDRLIGLARIYWKQNSFRIDLY